MTRVELRFELKPDGGLERGYEAADRIRDFANSIHAKVEDGCLRVVLNNALNTDINALVADVTDRIEPDPDGKEFA